MRGAPLFGLLAVLAAACVLDRFGGRTPAGEGGASNSRGGAAGQGGDLLGGGGRGGASEDGGGGTGGTPAACGDATTDPGEACDDGNEEAFDGCTPRCLLDGSDDCPPGTTISLAPHTPVVVEATTAGQSDDEGAECTVDLEDAPDVVVAVTPQAGGFVEADLAAAFDTTLVVQTSCGGADLDCAGSDDGDLTLVFPVSAGSTYYVVVDGAAAADQGSFTLTLTLHVCGDGVLAPLVEECDDQNAAPLDGCDPGCVVECNADPTAAVTSKEPATHHCYKLFSANPVIWTAAEVDCTLVGAGWHLATITSDQERDFIDTVIDPTGGTWIGLSDISVEGTFVWANGEPFSYTSWNGGEPNNFGGGEDCVESIEEDPSQTDDWNDLGCNNTRPYLCELTPPGT
jgi:cysteine-rich repeat protein